VTPVRFGRLSRGLWEQRRIGRWGTGNFTEHDMNRRKVIDRIIGVGGNIPFEDMTGDEIEVCLLQMDLVGRFDGDIEFLNLVRNGAYTEQDIRRMRELYDMAKSRPIHLHDFTR
jgi:hypothetical protein